MPKFFESSRSYSWNFSAPVWRETAYNPDGGIIYWDDATPDRDAEIDSFLSVWIRENVPDYHQGVCVTAHIRCKGCFSPACWDHPSEVDDERLIEDAEAQAYDGEAVPIPEDLWDKLYQVFEKEIDTLQGSGDD